MGTGHHDPCWVSVALSCHRQTFRAFAAGTHRFWGNPLKSARCRACHVSHRKCGVCGQAGSDDSVFRSAATQLLHACRHQASLEQRNATADDHLAPAC
ncbi:Uncharacterised protein [Vibrio cholerae]|nr:Uncharacterised protein [Vibrio cholerae]